jgi:hypothetical protein
MATAWHPEDDEAPVLGEADLMAVVLEGRHGSHAADVAEFFANLHHQHGDGSRSRAWAGVAVAVRKRADQRILGS